MDSANVEEIQNDPNIRVPARVRERWQRTWNGHVRKPLFPCQFDERINPWNCRTRTYAIGRWRAGMPALTASSSSASNQPGSIAVLSVPPARPSFQIARFYASAAAAQDAGLRPCLRCRPETAPEMASWRGTSNTVSRGLALPAPRTRRRNVPRHTAPPPWPAPGWTRTRPRSGPGPPCGVRVHRADHARARDRDT